jgi:hypothetical protein
LLLEPRSRAADSLIATAPLDSASSKQFASSILIEVTHSDELPTQVRQLVFENMRIVAIAITMQSKGVEASCTICLPHAEERSEEADADRPDRNLM